MRTVAGTDLKVFPLCLGANPFGWTADARASEEILDAFLAAGGNFFDTADSYSAWVPGNVGGESETILGNWMASRKCRDRMVVATKVGGHPQHKGLAAASVAAACDASLRRLRTDRINLYYAHYDDPELPIEAIAKTFDGLVRAGKVRHVGVSNMEPERIRAWCEVARQNGWAKPVALQPHYNLVARRSYEERYLPVVEEEKLAVFPYFGLAAGFLTGKYQSPADAQGVARGRAVSKYLTPEGFRVVDELRRIADARRVTPATVALAWLLARPSITAPIASGSRAEQLPDLLAAATFRLEAEEVARLDAVSAPFA